MCGWLWRESFWNKSLQSPCHQRAEEQPENKAPSSQERGNQKHEEQKKRKCFTRCKTISKYRNQVIFSWLKFYGTENNVYGSVYPGTHTGNKSVFSTSPCLQSTPVVPIYTPTASSAIILKKICLPSIPIVGQAGFLLILKFSSCKTSV